MAAATLPVLDDEAYYWAWSRHLQWGYLDHPPAVAVLLAAATRVLGDSPWALRVPSFLLAAATAWVVFRFTQDLYGPEAARRSQWAFHATPLFVAGGVVVSPDAPFVFLWALSCWAAWHALRGRRAAWWAVGATVGLGLQSKYSMAFLVPAVAALAFADRAVRRAAGPYAAGLVAVLVFLPNLLWNSQHNWRGFRFVVERGAWVQAGWAGNLVLSVGGVLLYLSPVLAGLLLAALWRGQTAPDRFLRTLCVPTLAVSLVAALAGKFKPHYIAPVALLAVPALASWASSAAVRRWAAAGAVLGAVQSVAVVVLAAASTWEPALLADQRGWDRVAQAVAHLAPHPATVLVTTTYQNAGQLSYALRERYPVAVLPGPHTFDQWSPLHRHLGRPAVLVYDENTAPAPAYITWCRVPQRVEVVFPDPARPLRRFLLVRCASFSPPVP